MSSLAAVEQTVPAERVLAHELGHILIGSDHPADPERLMASGKNVTLLTQEETQKASDKALALSA